MRFGTTIAGVGEPTFVLIHGLASTRRIWDLTVPLFAREHKVIAFDMRGHGETEKPEEGYALADLAEDVDELLRRYGVTRPVLVGHSAGANVALHHAVTRRSARAVILVDGGFVEMHEHLSWEDASALLAPPGDDGYRIEKFVREGWPGVASSPQLVEIRRSFFEWGRGGEAHNRLPADRHIAILRSLWEQDVHADLARLLCPALVVVCRSPDEDPARARQKRFAAARVARLPHVRTATFEQTIHDIPIQRPRELTEAMLAFTNALVGKERELSRR